MDPARCLISTSPPRARWPSPASEVAGCLLGRARWECLPGVAKNGMVVAEGEWYRVSCVAFPQLPAQLRARGSPHATCLLRSLLCSALSRLRLTIDLSYGSVLLRDARIGGKQSKRASERNGILTAREKAHDTRFRAETTSEDKKHGANFASKQNKLMNKCAIDADGANLHLNYMIVCNNFSFWIFGSQMR